MINFDSFDILVESFEMVLSLLWSFATSMLETPQTAFILVLFVFLCVLPKKKSCRRY